MPRPRICQNAERSPQVDSKARRLEAVSAPHVRSNEAFLDLFASAGVGPSNDGPSLRVWATHPAEAC
jgi:hypothetical protein